MPRCTRALMSRKAMSDDAFVIAAHLALVSLPSKPSSSRLMTLRWRSFKGWTATDSQNSALRMTLARMVSARSEERHGGKEGVRTCRSRWWRYQYKKKKKNTNEN